MPNTGSPFSCSEISTSPSLRLADPHGALDLGRLEQRGIGMDRDGELAAGRVRNLLGEGAEILDVKVVGRIGGRQSPSHLRVCGRSRQRDRSSGRERQRSCD